MRDIYVYGYIGDTLDETDKTAYQFARDLKEANGEDVTIHINSGGGDVFDANTMAETLRAYPGRSTAAIEGLAASAASYFALTADTVTMNKAALIMIHNPYTVAMGDADEMRRTADYLDKVRSTIISQYADKTGKDSDEIAGMMDAETWFTAEEALEAGLVDELSALEPVANRVDIDRTENFKNAPAALDALKERLAGNRADTMHAVNDSDGKDTEPAGAAGEGAGAAHRTVCIDGRFLNY